MATKSHKGYKQVPRGILCLFVALSFFVTLLPVVSATSDTMPCCVGKTAGHCESGITPKEDRPPASEPMCGLDNSEFEEDEITIVAESPHHDSQEAPGQTAETTSHAAESNALSAPCQMECGACAASSTQQRRERSILRSAASHNPSLIVHSRFENQPFSFSSNQDWEQTSPRGPPADLL